MSSISNKISELTNRVGAHWESTWKWDRFANERTQLVQDTQAVMLESLGDSAPLPQTLEAERSYIEKFSRVIIPKKTPQDVGREITKFEQAVKKRVKAADGIIEEFIQKTRKEAERYFFQSLLFPEKQAVDKEVRLLEKRAEELRSESLALLVEGLDKCKSDAGKTARYEQNRKRVARNLDAINNLITTLKVSEERLRADIDFDKGEFTIRQIPLAKAYYEANTYRNQTIRFFSKLYANPKHEMIRQAAAHPVAAIAVGVLATGVGIAVAPKVIPAIASLMTLMTPQKVMGAVLVGIPLLGWLRSKK